MVFCILRLYIMFKEKNGLAVLLGHLVGNNCV